MATPIPLTSEQKSKIQKVVGHNLDEVNDNLGAVGNVTLDLTDNQKALVQQATGKNLSKLELTEQDLKKFSSTGCYERGGIVLT
jgi:hypothetical protein